MNNIEPQKTIPIQIKSPTVSPINLIAFNKISKRDAPSPTSFHVNHQIQPGLTFIQPFFNVLPSEITVYLLSLSHCLTLSSSASPYIYPSVPSRWWLHWMFPNVFHTFAYFIETNQSVCPQKNPNYNKPFTGRGTIKSESVIWVCTLVVCKIILFVSCEIVFFCWATGSFK